MVGQCLTNSCEGFRLGSMFHTTRFLKTLSYRIRVMLGHLRLKEAAFRKKPESCNDGPDLKKLYALFAADKKGCAGQLKDAKCPFISFREGSSSEEEDAVEDDDAVCVYKQLQIGETMMMGVMLRSDGARIAADRYEAGVDGFIVCRWKDGEVFETTVPNQYIEPEGKFILKPDPPSATPKAKAKAKLVLKRPAMSPAVAEAKGKAKAKLVSKRPAMSPAEEVAEVKDKGVTEEAAEEVAEVKDKGEKQDRLFNTWVLSYVQALHFTNGRALLDQIRHKVS